MTGKSNVLYPVNLVTLCRHADIKAIDSQSSARRRRYKIAKSVFDKISFMTNMCVCIYMSVIKNNLSEIIFIANIRCHNKSQFTVSYVNTTAFGDLFYRNKCWQKLRDLYRIPIILIDLVRISSENANHDVTKIPVIIITVAPLC